MKTYDASDFRSLFQNRFNLAHWKDLLAHFFGTTQLLEKPEVIKLPPSEHDVKGWLLGELTTIDGCRVGLFRYEVPAAQVNRRKQGLRHLVDPWIKYDFDAALVVFDSRTTERWRFSLISDMKGEKTSPKRFTYVFGDSTSLHRTAVDRFLLLQRLGAEKASNADCPFSFAALRDAFAVETLTKEFYGELFAWYQWAVSDESGVTFPNDIATDSDDRIGLEERLIRLVTRMMFVWFILQKKLVPKQLFDERQLTAWLKDFDPHSEKQGNYYNAILQNLFFATLNNEIPNRAFATDVWDGRGRAEDYGIKTLFRNPKGDSWFKRSNEDVLRLFREVPFLNGGLFECLDKPAADDPKGRIVYNDGFSREKGRQRRAFIPNELFFGEEKSRTFGGCSRTVSGLLKILAKYNFTIEENAPDDMDVALDPELLGKVFENLLGTFNPETRETARNSSGSFYTPREIVNYMVDEALNAYMKPVEGRSKEEQRAHLRKIKVLDPACGSGAFPMGMLNAIVRRLIDLGEDANDLHALKLHVIENCIYGVDIQTIAVQISKLRFFISLVCEEKPNQCDIDGNYGISPLPNLETKFVAANSLIAKEKPEAQGNLFETAQIDGLKTSLYEVRHRHFGAKTRKDKLVLRKEDEKMRKELVFRLTDNNLFKAADARQLAAWNPYDQNTSADFFDPEWMFGVKNGFDIVIGNPPYVKLEKIEDQSRLLEKQGYEVFTKRGDLYCIFTERGFKLLKAGGTLSYIMSNKWLQAEYGRPLRKYFLQHELTSLIDFGDNDLFKGATVYSCIFVARKASPALEFECVYMRYYNPNTFPYDILNWRTKFQMAKLTDDTWVLSETTGAILEKLKASCTTLSDFISGEAYYGIKPGTTKAFIVDDNVHDNLVKQDPNSAKLLFPMVRGRDVQRYHVSGTSAWLIGTHNGYATTPPVDVDMYPAIKDWLTKFYDALSSRADQGVTPFNLRDCAYWEVFRSPKIMYQKFQVAPCFVYNETGLYCNDSMWIMPTPNKALVGVLNSKMGWWLISKFCTQIKNGYQLIWEYFGKIPVPKTLPPELTALVEEILAAKKNPTVDVSALEERIDNLVFDLYGLTPEEREIVTGGGK